MPTLRPPRILSPFHSLLAILIALPTFPARVAAQTAPTVPVPPAYRPWSGLADLVVNTSQSGAYMATEVRDFPMLVRLRAPDFPFAQARGRGQDIRFTDAAGKPLPFEIDTWDSAGAKADIWVLVDTVRADNATQHIRMYWGNPAAQDASNPGAVFAATRGLEAVWHLGGAGTAERPNAVPGGNAAVPVNFVGGESRPGMVGLGDSLDGAVEGKYLDVGEGYADYSTGFTYSAWVKSSSVKVWGRLMDFGNGMESDNIILGRDAGTDNLAIHIYPGMGNAHSRLYTGPFFTLGQWHHVAVAIHPDDSVKAYLDGLEIWSGALSGPIRNIPRTRNWLGRSHWPADQYWHGLYDEVRIEKTPRDMAWIRLSYLSQRADASLISFQRREGCTPAFSLPADTTVAEGASLVLSAQADCATSIRWAVAAGLPVNLPDPASKTLAFAVPRVVLDTQVVLTFTATFDTTRTGLVRVRVRETIPEPRFNLPDSMAFGAADSLVLIPAFTNLPAINASPNPTLNLDWKVSGQTLDTSRAGLALILRRPGQAGSASVVLCADNGGPPTCKTVRVTNGVGTGLRKGKPRSAKPSASQVRRWRRVDGRMDAGGGLRPRFAPPANH